MANRDTLALLVAALAPSVLDKIPASAVPFVATNQTIIDSTTARDIKTAVTGKKHWIIGIDVTNKTAAEDVILLIKDNTGTPILLAAVLAKSVETKRYDFKVPIEVGAGLKITGEAVASLGDCYVTAYGFVEA